MLSGTFGGTVNPSPFATYYWWIGEVGVHYEWVDGCMDGMDA